MPGLTFAVETVIQLVDMAILEIGRMWITPEGDSAVVEY